MRGVSAAAITGYLAMIALQINFVTPRPAEGATLRLGQVLSIGGDAGVCVLPVCLLGTPCVLGVGGTCLLPATPPAPVAPQPRTPQSAPPAAAAPPPATVAIRPAPAPAHAAPRVTAVHAAAPPPAPAPVVVAVARPVAAVPIVQAPPLGTGALPAPATVLAPRTASPAPEGGAWWLYALFVVIDLAAAIALALLIRRTAAAPSRR
jgi:hypothetical protein